MQRTPRKAARPQEAKSWTVEQDGEAAAQELRDGMRRARARLSRLWGEMDHNADDRG